jgi:hypothetical protein
LARFQRSPATDAQDDLGICVAVEALTFHFRTMAAFIDASLPSYTPARLRPL